MNWTYHFLCILWFGDWLKLCLGKWYELIRKNPFCTSSVILHHWHLISYACFSYLNYVIYKKDNKYPLRHTYVLCAYDIYGRWITILPSKEKERGKPGKKMERKRQLKSWKERPLSFIQLGFIFTCRCISKIGTYSAGTLVLPQLDFRLRQNLLGLKGGYYIIRFI